MSSSQRRTRGFGIVTLLGLVAALLSFTSVMAAPAGAGPVDACGVAGLDVPDSEPGVFDFTAACVAHDACYGIGGGWWDRYRCDRAFLTDMKASCSTTWRGWSNVRKRIRCEGVAYTYYAGVRLGGWAFFN